MKIADIPLPVWAGLGLVLVLVLAKRNAASIGEAVGSAVVDAGTGVVYGIGDAVGVPRTDESRCAAALASRSFWEATAYCPAGRLFEGWQGPPIIMYGA